MYGQIYSNSVKGTVRSIFSKNQLQKKLNKSELIFKHYFLDQLIEIQNQDLQQKIVITKWSLGSPYITTFHLILCLNTQISKKR